jgi:hypothetical protein
MSVNKKSKFTLTSDLVTLEKEPVSDTSVQMYEKQNIQKKFSSSVDKEQFNMRINVKIKKSFQIWCIENNKQMSEVVEDLIEKMLEKSKI